jgi:hypothetical protein
LVAIRQPSGKRYRPPVSRPRFALTGWPAPALEIGHQSLTDGIPRLRPRRWKDGGVSFRRDGALVMERFLNAIAVLHGGGSNLSDSLRRKVCRMRRPHVSARRSPASANANTVCEPQVQWELAPDGSAGRGTTSEYWARKCCARIEHVQEQPTHAHLHHFTEKGILDISHSAASRFVRRGFAAKVNESKIE